MADEVQHREMKSCTLSTQLTIYHFMLHCTAYKEQRSQSIHLQQPYLESDQNSLDSSYLIKKTLR